MRQLTDMFLQLSSTILQLFAFVDSANGSHRSRAASASATPARQIYSAERTKNASKAGGRKWKSTGKGERKREMVGLQLCGGCCHLSLRSVRRRFSMAARQLILARIFSVRAPSFSSPFPPTLPPLRARTLCVRVKNESPKRARRAGNAQWSKDVFATQMIYDVLWHFLRSFFVFIFIFLCISGRSLVSSRTERARAIGTCGADLELIARAVKIEEFLDHFVNAPRLPHEVADGRAAPSPLRWLYIRMMPHSQISTNDELVFPRLRRALFAGDFFTAAGREREDNFFALTCFGR